jgi:hypothetical protein
MGRRRKAPTPYVFVPSTFSPVHTGLYDDRVKSRAEYIEKYADFYYF